MRVIFLDFDGVLNHQQWYEDFYEKHGRAPYFGGEHDREHLDPACLHRLNRICQETKAKIVVSSSWRILMPDHKELASLLSQAGLAKASWVIGRTPRHVTRRGGRGREIEHWLLNSAPRKVTSFIILDDDRDMTPHMDRLVHCGFVNGKALGLTDKLVDRAIRMLIDPVNKETEALLPLEDT